MKHPRTMSGIASSKIEPSRYPSRLIPIASSTRLSVLERISRATLERYALPSRPSKGGQGCLAKSPKACTPGGIQPPSCLRPGRIAPRPLALPMHFHPPGSRFVKLDLRMACRRFVIPAGYILAKAPPALVISRSMNSLP